MEMQKMYQVRPDDIMQLHQHQVIITEDDEHLLGLTEFTLTKNPEIQGSIVTLETINKKTGNPQTIRINMHVPREIYLSKINSGWRKLF